MLERRPAALLYAFVATLSFSMAASNVILYLAVALFILHAIRTREIPAIPFWVIPYVLFCCWSLVAAVLGPNVDEGMIPEKILYVTIPMLVLSSRLRFFDLRWFFYILVLSNTFLIMLAPLVSPFFPDAPLIRRLANWASVYSGLFTVSIAYAIFLVMILATGIVVLRREHDPRWRGVGIAGWIACFIALLLTTSRTGWIAFAAMVATFAVFDRKLRKALFAFLAGSIVLSAVPALDDVPLFGDVRQRIVKTIHGYSSGREVIWRVGWRMFRESPWLGSGIGSVGARYDGIVRSLEDVSEERRNMHYTELHNQYLQIAVEQGLVGLSLFLWILYALLEHFTRAAAAGRGGDCAHLGVALVVIQIVSGFFQCSFFYSNIARLFWFLIGICYVETIRPVKHGNDGRSLLP